MLLQEFLLELVILLRNLSLIVDMKTHAHRNCRSTTSRGEKQELGKSMRKKGQCVAEELKRITI